MDHLPVVEDGLECPSTGIGYRHIKHLLERAQRIDHIAGQNATNNKMLPFPRPGMARKFAISQLKAASFGLSINARFHPGNTNPKKGTRTKDGDFVSQANPLAAVARMRS